MTAKTLADRQTRDEFRNAVAAIAQKEVGYIEGRGNNTKYGAWFGLNFHAWCAMFVSHVYDQAAKQVGCENPLRGVQTSKGFAGVTESFRKMKQRGWALGPNELPMIGDIVCWDHDEVAGGPGHTGIVVAVASNGYTTIEGNTNTAYSRTGGMVCKHEHRIMDQKHGVLLGFVRPTRRYGR